MNCVKVGYMSKAAARQGHSRASWRIKVYECPDCGMFHVANADKRDYGDPVWSDEATWRKVERQRKQPRRKHA